MATMSKIIPFLPPHVARRSVMLRTVARPDMHAILDMLRTIDPELIARFTPPRGGDLTRPSAAETSVPATATNRTDPTDTRSGMLQPPAPANDIPHLPHPATEARARTLTSLIFPDGSSRIFTASFRGQRMTCCLR